MRVCNSWVLALIGVILSAQWASADAQHQWIASVYLKRRANIPAPVARDNKPGTLGKGEILMGRATFVDDVPKAFADAERLALQAAREKWGAQWDTVEIHGVALLDEKAEVPLPADKIDSSRHLAGAAYITRGNNQRASQNFPLNDDKLQWQILLPEEDRDKVTFELKRQKKGAHTEDFREARWLRNGSVTEAETSGYHGAGYRWYIAFPDYHRVTLQPGLVPVQHGGSEADQSKTKTPNSPEELFGKYEGFWIVCYRAP